MRFLTQETSSIETRVDTKVAKVASNGFGETEKMFLTHEDTFKSTSKVDASNQAREKYQNEEIISIVVY